MVDVDYKKRQEPLDNYLYSELFFDILSKINYAQVLAEKQGKNPVVILRQLKKLKKIGLISISPTPENTQYNKTIYYINYVKIYKYLYMRKAKNLKVVLSKLDSLNELYNGLDLKKLLFYLDKKEYSKIDEILGKKKKYEDIINSIEKIPTPSDKDFINYIPPKKDVKKDNFLNVKPYYIEEYLYACNSLRKWYKGKTPPLNVLFEYFLQINDSDYRNLIWVVEFLFEHIAYFIGKNRSEEQEIVDLSKFKVGL